MSQRPTLQSFTGRLLLATPEAEDDPRVSILRSHPDTRRYLTFLPICSVDDARQLREKRAADEQICDFHIYLYSPNNDEPPKFVGMTGIFKIDTIHRSCEVGILISPEFHGRGLATEALHAVLRYAFEEKGMHRVNAETSIDNLPMRGWFEKVAGATLEARKRDGWVTTPGNYTDVMCYSILEGEWRETVKQRLEAKLEDSNCTQTR